MNALTYTLLHPTYSIIGWWFRRGHDWQNLKGTWTCPECSQKLVAGKEREYETLNDHVSNPNAETYPLRPTWICANEKCIAHGEMYWGEDGDLYIGYDALKTLRPKVISSATHSFTWMCDREREFRYTKIYKILTYEFGTFLCLFGLHSPIFRDERWGNAFCAGCHKELGKDVPKNHWLKVELRRI